MGLMLSFPLVRQARLLKLAKQLRGLMLLFQTVISSLPSLINVGALLTLLCYIYAVLGVSLFGKARPPPPAKPFQSPENAQQISSSIFSIFRGSVI